MPRPAGPRRTHGVANRTAAVNRAGRIWARLAVVCAAMSPPVPPPLPVVPIEPAWPAAAPPARPPGWPTALGVCSLVVAGVSLIGGGSAAVGGLFDHSLEAARAASVAPVPVGPIATGPAEVVDPDGLGAVDRQAVAFALNRAEPLSPAQQVQLDELLAEAGRTVVDPADPPAVTSAGRIGTLGGRAATDRPAYYALPRGRLEVDADHAVFFPADGRPAVRAVAYPIAPVLVDAVGPPPLPDAAVRSVLRTVARLNGRRPPAGQVRAITDLLAGSSQQVVLPTDGLDVDPAAEVVAATTGADGTLVVRTVHAGVACTLTVTPAGQVAAELAAADGKTPPASNPPAVWAVLGTAVVQLGLAVLLLVAGIAAVRRRPSARRLHWAYVGLKLPAAAAATAAVLWMWRAWPVGPAAWPAWAWPGVAGLAYPVAVAVVLRWTAHVQPSRV